MSSNKYKKNTREDYRLLCNIIDNVKCISITSNSDTEGKTIIAKNLAMVFAKKGKKTLFIDCSLVDKKKVKAFDKNKVTGLIGMLEAIDKAKVGRVNGVNIEDIHLKSFIIDSQYENLSTLQLGVNSLNNYNHVFKKEYLRTIMERLKKYYDYLIVDAPSFTNLSYMQILSAATDGCLFVIKEGVNEIKEGAEIKEKIGTLECKTLGCIFNKSNARDKVFDDINKKAINIKYTRKNSSTEINQKINDRSKLIYKDFDLE